MSALFHMSNYLHNGSLLTVIGQHTTAVWIVSACTTRVSMQKKHIRGDEESADSSAGQLLAAHATSECSVLTPGAWCAMLI